MSNRDRQNLAQLAKQDGREVTEQMMEMTHVLRERRRRLFQAIGDLPTEDLLTIYDKFHPVEWELSDWRPPAAPKALTGLVFGGNVRVYIKDKQHDAIYVKVGKTGWHTVVIENDDDGGHVKNVRKENITADYSDVEKMEPGETLPAPEPTEPPEVEATTVEAPPLETELVEAT